jgi:hypothetical protein
MQEIINNMRKFNTTLLMSRIMTCCIATRKNVQRDQYTRGAVGKLTVCSVVTGGGHAVHQAGWPSTPAADGIQQLLRNIQAGHHVLEDEILVRKFRPLARRERSAAPTHERAVLQLV